jgi:hypothetical protein
VPGGDRAAVLREDDKGDDEGDDDEGDGDEDGDEDGGAPRPAATRGGTDLPRRTASRCASWRETSSVLRCSATT